jgi:hypothetical protein
MSWENFKAGFNEPRELFAWLLTIAATVLLALGHVDQWGWLAACATSATLLGWMRRVEVGQLSVSRDEDSTDGS